MAQLGERVAALFPLPFIILLGWLASRSAVAALSVLPATASLDRVIAREPVSSSDLRAAATTFDHAAEWFDSGRYRLAAARLLVALPPAERGPALPLIEDRTRAALAAAPMSSYGWTLQAYLNLQRGDVSGARRAWELSTEIGRYIPDLMESRLALGLDIARHARGIEPAVIAQINVLATVDPAALARAARRVGGEPLVRQALKGSPAAADFERETANIVAAAIAEAQERTRNHQRISARLQP